MLIVCPNCKKRFALDPVSARVSKRLRCSCCRAVFRLVRKGEGARGCAGKLKVVIANESLPFCQAVRKVLSGEPFEIFICNDGKEALDAVERIQPELLLLDVALPTMFGFEVCERVRQNPELSGVKIVLIASIYDKTRYKRSPNSLYGADDYIEKHHIPDSLIPMIYRLASGSAPLLKRPTAPELAAQGETRAEIRQVEVSETSAPTLNPPPDLDLAAPMPAPPQPSPSTSEAHASFAPVSLPEVELKASRLARIIVSDIVLYNQGRVEQGVRDGSFYELLADDIREGELLYRQRVPQQVRDTTSYLEDAFEDLIAKKRAEMRI